MSSPQFKDLLKKCSCSVLKKNIWEFTEINDILPISYEYTMCEWSKVNEQHFECRFRVNVSTKDGAISWLDEFKVSSNTFYTKDKTFPENTQNNVYKVCLKCYHNTRPKNTVKQPISRNTGCPARLIITVKQTALSKKYQSTDIHLQEFPMIVLYRNRHNHNIDSAAALKYHSPNSNVKDIKYFEKGVTPMAGEVYTAELMKTYNEVLADSSLTSYSSCNISKEKKLLHTEEEMHIEPHINAELDFFEEKEEIENLNLDSLCRNSEERQKVIKKELSNCFQIIADKLTSNETLNAAEKFVINFKKLKTENSLNSALHCFGKFSEFSVKQAKSLLATSKKIGVQPMALPRSIQSGRPSRKRFTDEHSYSERPKSTLLPRKKIKNSCTA